MTNHWNDLRNADVILVMGANPASNHPISMKWITRAKERGGKLICVDPRFTQTAAVADLYAPIRSGTDIAFLGGMISYILEQNLYFKDYVVNYTDAAFLVNKDFKMPGELDGIFSGYNEQDSKYDRKSWAFQLDEKGVPARDLTLKDPNCVFQLLKKHYSRYTLDKVSQVTGTPKDTLEAVYQAIGSTGKPDRVATGCYAMGWTQHTVGVQNIRAFTIVQLLLGNIGMAGGGVNALRGEGNVQGSTDHGILFHILTGYLPAPSAALTSLKDYIEKFTPVTKEPKSVNWWSNRGKYMTSYLKAIYGDKATKENDFGYDWLPKLDEGMQASWLSLFVKMFFGGFEGFFVWGMNPACSSAGAGKVREAFGKLKWMVNVDLFDNETASFWRGPGVDPKEIKTEVFQLPCCSSVEKEGSISNSSRLAQWRYKAIEPMGQSLSDAEILNELQFRVKKLYQKEKGAFPEPIVNLSWEYGEKDKEGKVKQVDIHQVAKEINGYYLEDLYDKKVDPPKLIGKKGDLVTNFVSLQADGSTSSGNWLYSGSYTQKDGKAVNMMARRGKEDPTGLGLYPNWSWTWPLNRRIIYNRASVDPNGKPWDLKRPVITWVPPDAATGKPGAWAGDIPDGPAPPLAMEKDGKLPFIMKPLGVGSIFGSGLGDGPFPEHYEPLESPLPENPMSKKHRVNPTLPVAKLQARAKDPNFLFSFDHEKYPIVATTYRLSEHWQTGVMTRPVPALLEMQPQMFVEMSLELAEDKGIGNGDMVEVTSARGRITCPAMVTDRIRTMEIMGTTIHMVGMPWHFGWQYPADGSGGDSINLLIPFMGDPNTLIPESKAFLVNISKLAEQPAAQPAKKTRKGKGR
jgi:formate dehydrogenase major subunit